MSTLVAELRRRLLPSRGLAAALAGMCVYFGVILVPEWRPGFAGTGVFFAYILSIPFTLLGLLGLAIWGMVGAIAAHRRGLVYQQTPSYLCRFTRGWRRDIRVHDRTRSRDQGAAADRLSRA
jgi:hypothetical protein